jgi:hypothetical protein
VSAIEFAPEGPELLAPAAVVRWLVDDEGAPPDELTEGGAVHPRSSWGSRAAAARGAAGSPRPAQ